LKKQEEIRILIDPEVIDRNEWSAFVRSHPDGNIFQTPEYFDFCKFAKPCDGIVVCSVNGDRITGILVAQIIKDHNGIVGKITSRSVVMGGPLVQDNNTEIADLLIQAYGKESKNLLYNQIRNLADISSFSNRLLSAGYKFEQHLNILIDLSLNTNDLWAGIHPVRKKQVKRGQRRGVEVKNYCQIEENTLLTCYGLLKRTYKKKGLPLPEFDFFRIAIELFSPIGAIRLFVAEYASEIIGFRLVLCYNGNIYDWYAASSHAHTDKYPNDMLPWEIIFWGSNNGYKTFDFGGAGKPGEPYGVRDYKQKFGGKMVNFGRYTLVHRKIHFNFLMLLFRLRSKICSVK
jgi:serine/alanine adding enzyme